MLGGYRRRLAAVAEQLYPEFVVPGLERTGIIAHPSWLPAEPVPLRSVVLDLDEHVAPPAVTGSERESAQVRPLASAVQRYQRYSHAVRDLASPRLFENRLCFRVVGVDWTMPVVQLQFGAMCFFDSIDTNEALAHEMAMHHLSRDNRGDVAVGRASWRRLAFRKLVGDPFDLSRRPLMGAIGTLTIRGGESPSMVLHQRDGGRVAGGGGMVHLLPAGIFQPSSVLPGAIAADFSVWRNIQREYSEELLGSAEHDGSGRPIDYAGLEPFVTMGRALSDGRIRVYCRLRATRSPGYVKLSNCHREPPLQFTSRGTTGMSSLPGSKNRSKQRPQLNKSGEASKDHVSHVTTPVTAETTAADLMSSPRFHQRMAEPACPSRNGFLAWIRGPISVADRRVNGKVPSDLG